METVFSWIVFRGFQLNIELDASKEKRLRELELENGTLKRLLAGAHLDIHALKASFGTVVVKLFRTNQ